MAFVLCAQPETSDRWFWQTSQVFLRLQKTDAGSAAVSARVRAPAHKSRVQSPQRPCSARICRLAETRAARQRSRQDRRAVRSSAGVTRRR